MQRSPEDNFRPREASSSLEIGKLVKLTPNFDAEVLRDYGRADWTKDVSYQLPEGGTTFLDFGSEIVAIGQSAEDRNSVMITTMSNSETDGGWQGTIFQRDGKSTRIEIGWGEQNAIGVRKGSFFESENTARINVAGGGVGSIAEKGLEIKIPKRGSKEPVLIKALQPGIKQIVDR